jgi:hypothetical protein
MRATREAARRLRECNPVADDAYAGAAGERLGQITFEHIITSPTQSAVTTAAEDATGPSRRRRAGFLAGGLGLTSAAVAAVIVVASAGPVVPGVPAHPGHHGPAGQSAAQRFLLDAAATAAATPERSGTYWYVGNVFTGPGPGGRWTNLMWIARNGRKSWLWLGTKKHGHLHTFPPWSRPGWSLLAGPIGAQLPYAMLMRGHNPLQSFEAAARIGRVSFRQLQSLPTSPAALKARITALTRNNKVPESVAVFGSLINLVTGLPAPPQVRAAAFRALATLPIVTAVVAVHGRPALRINTSMFLGPRYTTLVVDPATSAVRAVWSDGHDSTESVTARWVNTRIPPINDVTP